MIMAFITKLKILYADIIAALGFTPENAANKGAANGYAPLDGNEKLPISNLPNTTVAAGVYGNATQAPQYTVDAQGRLTSSTNVTITPAFSNVTDKPTTLSGYGIIDAQPLDSDLTAIAALSPLADNFIVGNGTAWIQETREQARTSLGLGTIATQNASTVAITGGSIAGIIDLAIADGGTGASTQQAAINALAGATTAGQYLRGTGTNVTMSAIQAADVPTLNQSTTGNAATATALQTARTINGVTFDGTQNITVADSTKLPLTGGTVSGNLVLTGSFSTGDFLGGTTAQFGAGKVRIGGGLDNGANTVLSLAPGVVQFDAPGVVGGRLIINSSGNVLIGNPADTSSKLSVNGSGNFAGGISAEEFLKTGGTSNEFLKANGTTDVIPYFNPRLGFTHYTDFLRWSAGGDGFFVQTVTGTGATTGNMAAYTDKNVGVLRLGTGTTATGRAAIATQLDILALGGGSVTCVSGVSTFIDSDATNTYVNTIGLFDNILGVNQSDGVYFLYDTSGASTGSAASNNWQCVTCSNSVRTFTTTTITAIGSSTIFYNLRIEINSNATLVQFYIDDALVATHTTNIPVGINRTVGFGAHILKTVGITNRVLHLDYMGLTMKFTPQR